MDLYQSLVTVNPVTLIAQICNLFLQMFLVKVFFLDKIKAILDARREAADKEIIDAKAAKEEAMVIKATYEQNMLESKAKAEKILQNAQQTAALRGEQIISDAQKTAVAMKQKAEAEIVQEKKRALNDAKNEAANIISRAEQRAAMLVSQQEIVRQANAKANELNATAQAQTKELRDLTNKYVDNMLTKVEELLSNDLIDVKKARNALKNTIK